MNIMGVGVSLVALAALAGIIIGWCVRNFFSGSEKRIRQHVAHDIDEAAKDVQHLRRALDNKNEELQQARGELHNLRRKDSSATSDTRTQVAEINDLKQDLATTKKALRDNQSEFITFRTDANKDRKKLQTELSKYTAGGAASTERLNDANETIGALRSAVRENDKVIDSLRARIKEADGTVENLRSQLKSAQSDRSHVETVSLDYDRKIETLSKEVETTTATVEKQKREYDLMLENKNKDIKTLQGKLEETTTSTSELKSREHDFKKQENKLKTEIVDLKRVISDRDQALSKAKLQSSELSNQIKSAQAKIEDTSEARAKIKSKSAEVSALNKMLTDSANKRDSLQKNVKELESTLNTKDTDLQKMRVELDDVVANRNDISAQLGELQRSLSGKDTDIKKVRTELDDVVASRNKVSAQLGELQSKGNIALEKLQQDFNSLTNTRDEYKLRIDGLQKEVTELKQSKDQLSTLNTNSEATYQAKEEKLKGESKVWQTEAKKLNKTIDEYKSRVDSLNSQISELSQSKENQLRELRSELTTTAQTNETRFKTETAELTHNNNLLKNDLKILQTKLHDQTRSIEQQKSDLAKQIDINQRAEVKLQEKDNQLTKYRERLNREESESQRLNRELSDAEALRFSLTEKDAELRKTQIELQDAAATGGPAQQLLDDQKRQNESLTLALQERDEELNRLNTQMTNNRLRSKQQESSITLLTQEKESQAALVKSLEQQAENTLQLHTKIAQQSTELEDLRARLYERGNNNGLAGTLAQGLAHGAAGVGTDKVENNQTTAHGSNGLQQIETAQSASTKPRVFVRSDADTESLTGATGYQTVQRAQYTLDGHRIRRADGDDDLTLLPGVTDPIASAFNRNGVTTFDQIVHWTDREISHYAENVGVSVQRARGYNWPQASVSILNGTYRKDGQEIGN